MWGHRFDPWSGKIPHATKHLKARELQLLSPRASTTEAYVPQSLCFAMGEATALLLLTASRESPHEAKKKKKKNPRNKTKQKKQPSETKNK